MNTFVLRILIFVVFIMLDFSIAGCAMGREWVFHQFSFDAKNESPNIQILDWQYGEKSAEYDAMQQTGLRASRSQVEAGIPDSAGGGAGVIPVGDFLYVKWRVMPGGEIFEDKVDLTKRLPKNMKFYALHFVVDGPQLYIYLIPPTLPGVPPFNLPDISPSVWPSFVYAKSRRGDKDAIEYMKKHQIYPN